VLFEASNQHSLVPTDFEAPLPAKILQSHDRVLGTGGKLVRKSNEPRMWPMHYIGCVPSVAGCVLTWETRQDETRLNRSPPGMWGRHCVRAGPEAGALSAAAPQAGPESEQWCHVQSRWGIQGESGLTSAVPSCTCGRPRSCWCSLAGLD
jgi:hypothetical protein